MKKLIVAAIAMLFAAGAFAQSAGGTPHHKHHKHHHRAHRG
ncbi:hypothetical protein [Ralstonia sp. UBA689]|nr:hypothetical protein [Ralstonia sp. UBA689]